MLFNQTFPIESGNRDILLGLEWVIAFFCFEFFIIFLVKYLQRKQKDVSITNSLSNSPSDSAVLGHFQEYLNLVKFREIAWGILFLFVGLMYVMYIIGDFYMNNADNRHVFLYLGYIFFFLGIIGLAFTIERNELNYMRFFYTKVLIGFILVMIILIILQSSSTVVILLLIWPFVFVMFIQYIRKMISRAKGMKTLLIPLYTLFIGLLILIFGFSLSTDMIMDYFGEAVRLIGDLIQLVAVILCAISFYFLPSFSEYDWLEKIRALFIIHPSGIAIFSHDFRPSNQQKIETDLTSGAIIAIKSIIEEMSLTGKQLESIKKAGFTILMEYGQYILSVMFVDEDSVSLRDKNHEFCKRFEDMFPNLKYFYGNVDQFNKAEEIIKKIFALSD